jgi:hypothetical protein
VTTKTIYNIPHKVGPRRLALKFVNGAWVTSTRLNSEIVDTPPANPDERGSTARAVGKTTAVTFLQAKQLYYRITEQGSTRAREARELGIDKYTVSRVLDMYEGVGQSAFMRYQ